MKTNNIQYVLIAFLSIIFSINAQAQGFEWAKVIGSTGIDFPRDMVTDASGNSYVVGTFNSPAATIAGSTLIGPGNTAAFDVFIAKYDNAGNGLWAVAFQGSGEDIGLAIDQDDAGNIYVTGTYKDSLTIGTQLLLSNTTNNEDIFIAKFSSSGSFIWAKSANGNNRLFANDIIVNGNGDFYICGNYTSNVMFGGFPYTATGNNANAFLAKYDTDGNLLWFEKIYGTSGGGQSSLQDASSLCLSPDGKRVYLGGWFKGTVSWYAITLTDIGDDENLFVASYDTGGTAQWVEQIAAYQVNFSAQPDLLDLETQSNGNIIVAGRYGGGVIFNMTDSLEIDVSLTPGSWHYEGFITSLDTGGNYQWSTAIVGEDADVEAIAVDSRDYIFATGISEGPTQFGAVTAAIPTATPYFAEYNANGVAQTVKSVGAGSFAGVNAIDTDDNDEVYACGEFMSLLKLTPHQLTTTGIRSGWITKLGDATNVPNHTKLDIAIYPNPTGNQITIQMGQAKTLKQLNLYNIAGQQVYTIQTESSVINIDTSAFDSGTYLLELLTETGTSTQKLIIQH